MFEVRNGNRILRFEGALLASSTSRRDDSTRWIEFRLYKTVSGVYVLNRVGVSHVYHSAICSLVDRYGLHEEDVTVLGDYSVPCDQCHPDLEDPVVFPERFRYWTLTSSDAEAVVSALYKEDDNGARYMTKVADRLLESASVRDLDIDQAYHIQYI